MLQVLLGARSDLDQTLANTLANSSVDPERIDAENLTPADLPQLFQSATLFATQRLIIIKNIADNRPVLDALETYLGEIHDNPDLHVIIIEQKLDKRLSIYKKLKPYTTEFADFATKSPPNQLKWLAQTATTKNLNLDKTTSSFLLNWVGADQGRLESALEKLALSGDTSPSTIQQIIEPTPEQNVFTIFNSALLGDRATVNSAIDKLSLTSEPPQMFFGLITNQAFILSALILAQNSAKTPDQVARDLGVSPFILRNLTPHASRLRPAHARKLLRLFARADRDLKSTSLDPWLIIKNLLMQTSSL